MKWNLKSGNMAIICMLLVFTVHCEQKKSPDNDTAKKGRIVEPEAELFFLTESGDTVSTLKVAVSDTDMERSQGLMDVNEMPEDTGMLFIFDVERQQSFWMANTPIPLDIMYVNSDSVIVRIYQNTTPFSQNSLPSEYPARFVVETNGGYSVANGINEGMKIRF